MQARYPRTAPCGSLTLRDAGEFVETRRWFMPIIRTGCKAVFLRVLLATSRWPHRYLADYRGRCEMDCYRDVEDWLGGYLCEPVTPEQFTAYLSQVNGSLARAEARTCRLSLGESGFDEYPFRVGLGDP